MASSGASSSKEKAGQGGLDEMMRDLGIQEEDLDDVVFEEENPPDQDVNR